MDAIVIKDVSKSFKKSTVRHEHTTLKSELVRWFKRKRQAPQQGMIEALRQIDLTIPRGKTVGIIGRNGSGKSTLLKLITGIYTPTTGSIEVNGRISALLELGAGFHPEFSGRENILINGIIVGMSRAEVKQRMNDIIEFSELGEFIDEPVRTYSSGMFMRLAFAVATHVDPEILIVDEILAVGDDHFTRKSMAKMREFKKSGRTIVLVTHDLGNVATWCDSAAWIDEGRIRLQGDPAYVVDQYKQAVALSEARSEKQHAPPPGVGLPAVTQARPTSGPDVPPDKRWGNFQLELGHVQVLDRNGAQVSVVDPEDRLELRIPFTTKQPLTDVSFVVSLVRNDGLQVYGTSTKLENVTLPSPLPDQGTVTLHIDRLGLTEGNYTLDVGAQTRGGLDYDFHRGLYPLQVRSSIRDSGISRPPHRWEVQGAGANRRSA